MLSFRKNLENIPIYDGVEKNYRVKINANESTLNLPPLVEERVFGRLSHLAFNRYPNEEYYDLIEQIAKNFSVDKSQILLGNGSSEIIEKVFQVFGGEGKKIIFPQPSFSMYKIYAKVAEAESVIFNLDKKFDLNVDEFIKKIREENVNLAVICNPNNPTGNILSVEDIEKILSSIDCTLLLDEAYIEFHGKSAVNLVKKYKNLIVARTFSKAYGLAGARVGYMISSKEITDNVKKIFMPYHMNSLSLAVADIVFQMRDEFVPRIQIAVSERERMIKRLSEIKNLEVFPSRTNFILIRHEKADELNEFFESLGIGVRFFKGNESLKNCLRISIGTRAENDEVFDAMKNFLEEI
ncbi:MAG: histidinol-phosphate transaminase [Selenomonadaceae bacterium]|nr:histidinol-phosphate transaminase [Selenomonadaceae bacterium]